MRSGFTQMASDRAEQGSLAAGLSSQRASAELLRDARDARPAGAPLPCGVRAGRHRFSAIA